MRVIHLSSIHIERLDCVIIAVKYSLLKQQARSYTDVFPPTCISEVHLPPLYIPGCLWPTPGQLPTVRACACDPGPADSSVQHTHTAYI